jgi:hypothetical protein
MRCLSRSTKKSRDGFRVAGVAAVTVLVLGLAACASPAQYAERMARHGGMQMLLLQGATFEHVAFFGSGGGGRQLTVFIEGDGTPWSHDGTEIASDPSPRNPLALRLALRTPGPVLYLGRPCYFEPAAPRCSPREWTTARYSDEIVESLTTALTGFMHGRAFDSVVLVGHSGGGTLATLMAPRMPQVVEVITIGANLDISAWTRLHGYLPLDASLNPADLAPLPSRIVEHHLTGSRDRVVPDGTRARYTSRLPPESVTTFTDFDHVCCWDREWPRIWREIVQPVTASPPALR